MRNAIAVPVIVSVLCGCAGHITVEKATGSGWQEGVPWNLPMTQFKVVITRELKKCGDEPEAEVSATATPQQAVDVTQRYVLDNPGWFSSGKIESELTARGISSGLSSEVTDDTGPFITEATKVLGTIFLTRTRLGSPGFTKPNEQNKHPRKNGLCKPDVEDAVSALYPPKGTEGLQDQLDVATSVLAMTTAKTNRLSMLGGKSAAQKLALSNAMEEMETAVQVVDQLSRALVAAKKLSTQTTTIVWPPTGEVNMTCEEWEAPGKLGQRWFNDAGTWTKVAPTLAVRAEILRADAASGRWKRMPANTPACPAHPDTVASTDTDTQAPTSKRPSGLPVRLAGDGMLLLFKANTQPAVASWSLGQTPTGEPVVYALETPILQAGTIYFVPMQGRAFHSESATVKLDDAGNPTSIHVGQTGAGATQAAKAANDILGVVAGLGAARDANALADIKAKTDRYNANIALANAKAAAALSDAKATADAKASLANANLAQLKADEALTDARTAQAAQ